MSETALTKTIKNKVRGFKPEMNPKMRPVRWADEVQTPTGFVDVIRFEDYVAKDNSYCRVDTCKEPGSVFPCALCRGCVNKYNDYEIGILTTCYEVKITPEDFRSVNGHNFHGNRNYYAMPVAMYDKVRHLVPDDIGVLGYYESGHMKILKECVHREIPSTLLSILLYNALKKWVVKYSVDTPQP